MSYETLHRERPGAGFLISFKYYVMTKCMVLFLFILFVLKCYNYTLIKYRHVIFQWVNGKQVTFHEIGHLPFEVEITDVVVHNASNLLTVVVDNTLLSDTVPQGSIKDVITA